MVTSRTALVSVLVLAGATCISCNMLEDLMSGNFMKNAKDGNPLANGFKFPLFNGGDETTKVTLGGFFSKGFGQQSGAGDKKDKPEAEQGDKKGYEGAKKSEEKSGESKSEKSTGGEGKENEVAKKQEGFLGCKTPGEFLKLATNPPELVKRVTEYYNLDRAKFTEVMTKAAEASVQPATVCLKIIEKVFVPDACRLKLVCQLGKSFSFSKSYMPKLSARSMEGSSMMKAFYDGVQELECEAVYSSCKNGEPKLKKMFQSGGGGSGSGGQGAADSSGALASVMDAGKVGGQMMNMLTGNGQQ